MFTQPCFIRRNTPELRRKLDELGYKRSYPDYTEHCKTIFVYQYPIKGFDTPFYTVADSFDLPYAEGSALKGRFIDCGINEILFLALAALRDDSDKNQWFVDGKTGYVFFCPFDSIIESSNQFLCYIHLPSIHKLTVKELIEYFHEPSTEQRLENLENKSDC